MSKYILLDSGNFRKLEMVGDYKIIRPCPQAIWEPVLSVKEWQEGVNDVYIRSSSGGGNWQYRSLPKRWTTQVGDYNFLTKPTNFGHLGFFAEQQDSWQWLKETCSQHAGIKTMNLFAYTGGSSMAMQQGGADVTHVDAAKGIIDWGKETAKLNGIENIRWIIEDVNKFVDREIRRQSSYDAFVLDPPSYGRGVNGEVWKIEQHLITFIKKIIQLFSQQPKFLLLSCHSPNFTPKALENLMISFFGKQVTLQSGEMMIKESNGYRVISSGSYVRVIF